MLKLGAPVVLASASPRRMELLRQLVAEFEVDPSDVDEDKFICDDPVQTALDLACEKARNVAMRHPESLVIGGDTMVVIDRCQLAKPANSEDAARMIALLSGHTHSVITGVCLWTSIREASFAVTTEVEFRTLTNAEIAAYASTTEPLDKAGAYAIQGAAKQFVRSVRGSLSNVIGLPLEELEKTLATFAV